MFVLPKTYCILSHPGIATHTSKRVEGGIHAQPPFVGYQG